MYTRIKCKTLKVHRHWIYINVHCNYTTTLKIYLKQLYIIPSLKNILAMYTMVSQT